MYSSAQYINISSINEKLMCTIQFKAILVYPNTPNGVHKAKLKSNGYIASPFFKPFLIGNMSEISVYPDSAIDFIETNFY